MQFLYDETGIIKRKYRILISAFVAVLLLAGALFLYYHSPREQNWLVCVIYRLTGIYCPGCGSGRACYSILHGDFYQAFRYNPALIILMPWIGIYILAVWGQWLFTGRESVNGKIPVKLLYGILIALGVYMILRNIPIYPFSLLAPTKII